VETESQPGQSGEDEHYNAMKKKETKRSQITLEDIARKLRVTKVTVSKALRDHPDISTETSKKIKKVAREMGYSPNFWARNLSSNRSNSIGVVVPKIAHFFFSSVIEGIYEAAYQNNYEVILTVSQESAELERRHIATLLSMRVDGLIISLSQETKDFSIFNNLQGKGVAVTFMDRVPDKIKGFNTVVGDDFAGCKAATEHAISIGYRKIAHLAGFLHTNIGRDRYKGYESAMKENGITIKKEWVVYGGFGEVDGARGLKKLIESGGLPECIIAVTFPVAFGIYQAADELGLKIPDDIDLICFGNSGVSQFLAPPMSYVDQPTHELGRRAVELTVENIRQKQSFVPQSIKLPTKLVLCKTCTRKIATGKKMGAVRK